jgi:L-rhamnose isomerase
MDNGHYHPTESVADKISSLLLFNEKIALHITRAIRWDSDHVVAFDDETREIAKEVVRGGLDRVFLALDYFDASINRVAAWVIGGRNVNKALLFALLLPENELSELQKKSDFTKMLALSERMKTMPLSLVWDEYLRRSGVLSDDEWLDAVLKYEAEILPKRS